jgi:serine O-acetyltransferase
MNFEQHQLHSGEVITIPIPIRYSDCVELIRSDYYRYYGKTESLMKMFLKTLVLPPFALTFWLRLAQIRGFWYWSAKIIHRHYSQKFGFQIYPNMKVGYGFCLQHSICVVINPATIIGNNVNVSQFTQIGSSRENAAIIGDNVSLSPMISLVNDVHIGSNSTIGTGAVVTHDVPENATVAGVPAKVLHYNNPGHFVGSRWPLPKNDE